MKTMVILISLLLLAAAFSAFGQKKFGYMIIHARCGQRDGNRDRLYYSPVIELNQLDFPRYTDGIDPLIPRYSVRYYNYAIARWFESYLEDKYRIPLNAPAKYARSSITVIFNENNKASCDPEKTASPCFFLNAEELKLRRTADIARSKSPQMENAICEVIAL